MVHWPRGVSNKGGHRFKRGEFFRSRTRGFSAPPQVR